MDKDVLLIRNIILYCDKIQEAIDRFGDKEDDFIHDQHYHDVCSFYVTQIGENAKNLSTGIKEKYPETHWKGIVGMRNIISHAYQDTDLEMIWITILNEAPLLKGTCEKILRELQNS
jgi:uncharacterized protein with HEPN domain